MKKWLALAGAVVAGIAVLAIGVANLNAVLVEKKDWLEEQAGAAVGRPVAFDRLGVGIWPGLAVELSGLRIADDPG